MDVRSILLPTDFSECARHAVPVAADLARLLGARVVCLHVVEPVVQPVGWTPLAEPLPAAELGGQLEESAARDLPAFSQSAEFEGLEVEDVIARGDPAAEIVRAFDLEGTQSKWDELMTFATKWQSVEIVTASIDVAAFDDPAASAPPAVHTLYAIA